MERNNQTPYRQKDFADADDLLKENLDKISTGRLNPESLNSKNMELDSIRSSNFRPTGSSYSHVQSDEMPISEKILLPRYGVEEYSKNIWMGIICLLTKLPTK